jgi:hypothetical protein
LAKGLPDLVAFYEKHGAYGDSFEIVAFCLDWNEEIASMAQLDRVLQPVVENVWRGKQLPFPVLLDDESRTWKRYGLSGAGELLLIDPDGVLVKGNQNTLAGVLIPTGGSQNTNGR